MGLPIPRWVWRGMEERYTRVEQIERRVRMLFGVFGVYGVLLLEFKPAYPMGARQAQYLMTWSRTPTRTASSCKC